MAESTSPKKPVEEDGASAGRTSDQIIRLDSEREQRRVNTVIDDELEAPVALEPTALEAPSKEPQQASVAVAPPGPVKPRRSLTRPILFALLPVALVVGGVGSSISPEPGKYLAFLALYDAVFAILSWAAFEYVVTE